MKELGCQVAVWIILLSVIGKPPPWFVWLVVRVLYCEAGRSTLMDGFLACLVFWMDGNGLFLSLFCRGFVRSTGRRDRRGMKFSRSSLYGVCGK